MKSFLHLVLVLLCLAPMAPAQAADMEGMDHSKMMMPDKAQAEDVYAPAMKSMHENMMAVKPTGDADVDFVQGMIPHHQGAVDMAKILLEKGKDPELKKMAKDIIVAQEKEIAFMKGWLANHPQK